MVSSVMAKGKILIVEDSYVVAFHLQQALEEANYSPLEILDTAEAAVAFCETTRPDVIFMDIMLAGQMDGIEAARIILERFDIPIVFITALTDKSTLQRAALSRPYGYLKKPFEDEEVISILKQILPGQLAN